MVITPATMMTPALSPSSVKMAMAMAMAAQKTTSIAKDEKKFMNEFFLVIPMNLNKFLKEKEKRLFQQIIILCVFVIYV